MKVFISDVHEKSGITIRAIVMGEATEGETGRILGADFQLPYRHKKPYSLRLVQNPLYDYEAMMARHDELERLRQDYRQRTGSEPADVKLSNKGIWLIAHWYVVEDYIQDGLTVGMTVAAWEGLHRIKSVRLV